MKKLNVTANDLDDSDITLRCRLYKRAYYNETMFSSPIVHKVNNLVYTQEMIELGKHFRK